MIEKTKEIGGYFGLEEFRGKEPYPNAIAVNSARNALAYLIRSRKISKLYIPYYLCNSVSGVCEREGCLYEYYHIDKQFLPVFDKSLGDNEFLYVVNYFGQIDDRHIISIKKKYDRLICDNVQAFFNAPIDGVDTVYSCRKFFGVPDGGYVVTDSRLDGPMQTDVSMDRMRHVLGRFEGSASEYYGDFRKNDDMFEALDLSAMSMLTQNIMRGIDYDFVKRRREKNFDVLHELLKDKNGISVKRPVGPYAYPFYCQGGMEIKRALAQKKIFVPTLWPEVTVTEEVFEKNLAENVLPLPCDQRYDENDMKRIADEISDLIL